MRKKVFAVIFAALLITAAVLHIPQFKGSEITPREAAECVIKSLDEKSIESITNADSPEIEEIVFDTNPSIYYFSDKKTDVVGKALYKITFTTTSDALLGPMIFYVDKLSGSLIGTEYRY